MIMDKPDILITLLGSNPLVPVTSIKLLTKRNTQVFIILSRNTIDILNKIERWREKYFNNIELNRVIIDPYDPQLILDKLEEKLPSASFNGRIQIDTTGGTKQMLLGTLNYFNKNFPKEYDIVASYMVDSPWEIIETNLNTYTSQKVKISVNFSIQEIISLHQDRFDVKRPKIASLQYQVATELARIVSTKNGMDTFSRWKNNNIRRKCFRKNGRVKNNKELSEKKVSFKLIPTLDIILGDEASIEYSIDELRDILHFKNCKRVCNWFNGFWLETYVASLFNISPLNSIIDDININIQIFNPDFELDLVVLVKNRMYVISVSTTSDTYKGGKRDLKKKMFEVIIRSRQIGGWKTFFGLVCLSDNPDELSKEDDDYLIDRSVKVFGRKDLPDLGEKFKKWME